jgi:beta-aspartyl-peptidase (threonine type)
MEASVMDGKTLKAGAVGLLRDIRNPVRLARIVMEHTDHAFIVGEGAEKLAKLFNLERRNPVTELRLKYYEQQKQALLEGKFELPGAFRLGNCWRRSLGQRGNVAAATPTGGFSPKLPGRIGDSPLIGCGTYANNRRCMFSHGCRRNSHKALSGENRLQLHGGGKNSSGSC